MILLHECADRQCADLDTELGSGLGPVCVFEFTIIRNLHNPPDVGISLDLRCSLYAIAT